MWQRSIIKSNAKQALTGKYWLAFTVALISTLLLNGYTIYNAIHTQMQMTRLRENLYYYDSDSYFEEVVRMVSSSNTASTLWTLFNIFVGIAISVGVARFFVLNHYRQSRFETMFSGFRQNYWNCLGATLVTKIFIYLWSLLFLIPGIIKAYQYCMVPYLLADNPDLPGSRAREISRTMTDGEKGAIFVFQLSFLGWYLLGALCMGVGVLFVQPYFNASMAELYIFLRDQAIQYGRINPAELHLASAAPPPPPQQPWGNYPPQQPPYGM